MKSIQQYLRTHITAGSSIILMGGSVLLGLAIRNLDVSEFDAALETKARTLATLVLREDRLLEVNFAGEFMPEFETTGNPEYFQFRLQDGSCIERSDLLGDRDLPFLPHATGAPVFKNLGLPDGRRGRFVQIMFPPRAAGPHDTIPNRDGFHVQDGTDPDTAVVVLGVARSREELDELLLSVYLTLAGVDVLLIGLIALLVHKALDRGFQPLAHLNAQIASLRPDALTRIHLPDTPAEIAMLPATVNAFIEAMQASFVRERRFTSNVAHELRTPVAEFRAACEVGAKWSDDPDLVRRRFGNLQQSAVNMEHVLNRLLDLSRLDSGTIHLQPSETGVAALATACWTRASTRDPGTSLRFVNHIDPALRLTVDAVQLEMMVFNLLDNAVCYSMPNSDVTCTSTKGASGAWAVSICNHAHGITSQDLKHLFDRFWRKDAARTGGNHSGLGLSIVHAIAQALGIQVMADLTPEHLFTVSLLFPAQMSR